jgi:hypothetical protein
MDFWESTTLRLVEFISSLASSRFVRRDSDRPSGFSLVMSRRMYVIV